MSVLAGASCAKEGTDKAMPNRTAGTIVFNDVIFINLPLCFSPTGFPLRSHSLRLQPLLDGLALIARALLDLADQFFHAALGLRQIVIGHLSPLALDLARQLFELPFHLIAIHQTCSSTSAS